MEKFEVNKEQILLKALERQFSFVSPLVLRKLLKEKNVKINGERVKENKIVHAKDVIEIFIPSKYLDVEIPVVYEDDLVLIVNKPVKCEVVSDGQNQTLTTILQKKYGTIYPVHRLDTNTTGLVIFAKNREVKEEFIKCFKNNWLNKKYVAVVYAKDIPPHAYYRDYIKDDDSSKVVVSHDKSSRGLEAILEFEVKKSVGNLHLIDITLQTGRTHQIRAQLAYHQIFVVGDGKYGDKVANRINLTHTQKLCAYKLELNFPASSELSYLNKVKLELPIPFEI